jgi:hypothetical protein
MPRLGLRPRPGSRLPLLLAVQLHLLGLRVVARIELQL